MTTDLEAVISQMTLEEKAALCTGASAWTTTPVERLNIPEMIVADGPHGVRRVPDVQDMFNDMPLVSALMFQESAWDKHPENIVKDLLQQVRGMEQV